MSDSDDLYERLQEHNKVQEEFIIVAANEMRFSAQPILALSEFLLSKKGNIEEYKEVLDAIIRYAKRLRMLTENTIDATKIESHSLKVNKQYIKRYNNKCFIKRYNNKC